MRLQDIISNMTQSPSAPRWSAAVQDTPLGAITCVVSESGLTNVFFMGEDAVRQALDRQMMFNPPQGRKHLLDLALHQIAAYLCGEPQSFDLPFDFEGCSEFQQEVLVEVSRIPYGSVLTYGQLAGRVGGLQMARAVGRAVAANPLPLVVPCHRVLASEGHLGGYSGHKGVQTKAWLLQMEGYLLVS